MVETDMNLIAREVLLPVAMKSLAFVVGFKVFFDFNFYGFGV